MHISSSVIPEKPSTEAHFDGARIFFLSELFPESDALSRCPEVIRDIVTDVVGANQASPECVTAVALNVVATTLGPNVKIDQPGSPALSALFNVVVCHGAPRTLGWFGAVTARFTACVLEMQVALSLSGASRIEQEITQQGRDLNAAQKTIRPDPEVLSRLQGEFDQASARLKPRLFIGRTGFQDIVRSLPQSFDLGLTIISLGVDPGEELTRMKSAERSRIVELLNRSWSGTPLSLGKETYPGTVSILWQTRRSVKEIIGGRGFDPGFNAAPVLLFDENQGAGRPARLRSEAVWRGVIESLFKHRCRNTETVYHLNEEAEDVLEEFTRHIEDRLSSLPVEYRPHVAWLPDLARRISFFVWILNGAKETVIEAPATGDAVAVTKWLGRQHLLAVISALGVPDATARADKADRSAVMFGKIRAKEPLTRRELWRSYDNPRAEWFEPTLANLIASGRVCYNEQRQIIAAV